MGKSIGSIFYVMPGGTYIASIMGITRGVYINSEIGMDRWFSMSIIMGVNRVVYTASIMCMGTGFFLTIIMGLVKGVEKLLCALP
jgi:hypothetical protein